LAACRGGIQAGKPFALGQMKFHFFLKVALQAAAQQQCA
jgi:hypothetical protein